MHIYSGTMDLQNTYEIFLKTLQTQLPKTKWKKHYKVITLNIICVNLGIKPSFLWDIPQRITHTEIIHIITLLKSKLLLSQNIYVIILEDDLFVSNLESVKYMCNNVSTHFKFINSSFELKNPQLINSKHFLYIETMVDNFVLKVDTFLSENYNSINHLVLPNRQDWCMPTLFGILLGYPTVYWVSSVENCLTLVQLDVFKVEINLCNDNLSLDLYNFSVPSSLGLQIFIYDWFERLEKSTTYSLKITQCSKSVTNIIL